MCVCVCVCMWVGVYVRVCMCELVSTVNRGHTPTLHIQTEDNNANEDGPRFVDIIIVIIDIYMAHIAEASKRLETEGRVEMT